eukprot:jgi/Tetstr1/433079/TSEL_022413.t1
MGFTLDDLPTSHLSEASLRTLLGGVIDLNVMRNYIKAVSGAATALVINVCHTSHGIYNPTTRREIVTRDVIFDEEGDVTTLPSPHFSGAAQLSSPYIDLSDYHPTLVASAIAEVVRPYSAQMAALDLPAPTVRVSKAPRNYTDAISSNHPDDWKPSMDREIDSIISKTVTFVWIGVPELRRNNP